jgi:hypothetical protein
MITLCLSPEEISFLLDAIKSLDCDGDYVSEDRKFLLTSLGSEDLIDYLSKELDSYSNSL